MGLGVKLEIDCERECVLDDVLVPIVDHGKPLTGTVVLTAPGARNFSFHGLTMEVGVQKHCKTQPQTFDTQSFFPGKRQRQEPILQTGRKYCFDGALNVPFSLPAECLPPFETYDSNIMCVRHELRVYVQGMLLLWDSSVQPFVVQVLSPAPPNDLPETQWGWMTIGDCGGECKLLLRSSSDQYHATCNKLRALLRLRQTSPMERIKLLLYVAENEGAPSVCREFHVWERAKDAEVKPEDLELEIEVDLASTGRQDEIFPSIAPYATEAGAKMQATHELRLAVQPLHGAEAWNTMSVRLARTTSRGAPKGTLHVTPKPQMSNKQLAVLAMREFRKEPLWFKLSMILLVVFLCMTVTVTIGFLLLPHTTDSVINLAGTVAGMDPKKLNLALGQMHKIMGDEPAPDVRADGIAAFDRVSES
jgi:hypothetical protein